MACRFSVLVLLCVVTSVLTLEKGTFLDMSYGYDENTLAYPSVGFFQLSIGERGPTDNFPWLEYNYMSLPEHIGTHIDAPAHFAKGRMRVDDIPIGRLICAAVRVDISEKAKIDRDYGMTVQDLQDWEEIHGKIPDESLLFVYTGWGAFYPDRLAYQGTTRNDTYLDEQGESLVHSPGVGPEAGTWLVQNRNIVGLGIDGPNLDCGQNEEFMTHRVLMEADIYGIENVANLDQLPNTGAKVYALPMKIVDGSGAPVRIIAMLDGDSSSGTAMLWATFSVCGVFLVISLMFQ
ncbi:isatin hydrolase-like [Patiria miniata]|uniref:Cyclase n=1 Tax=Patiria miniata TaxID=46514 RepID=A0A914BKC4_PATMI|nr:isatin hydrolase-like [Patiria miniata]